MEGLQTKPTQPKPNQSCCTLFHGDRTQARFYGSTDAGTGLWGGARGGVLCQDDGSYSRESMGIFSWYISHPYGLHDRCSRTTETYIRTRVTQGTAATTNYSGMRRWPLTKHFHTFAGTLWVISQSPHNPPFHQTYTYTSKVYSGYFFSAHRRKTTRLTGNPRSTQTSLPPLATF